jgi:hypothetical protein
MKHRRRSRSGWKVLTGPTTFGLLAVLLIFVPASAQYDLKARRDHAVGSNPVGVIVADFDSDGNMDLISVDRGSDSLSLVKGFGDGTFRTLGTVAPGTIPTGAVYVDVNHDGFADLVTSNFLTQDVTVNLGNGFGSFAASIHSPVSITAFGITVGDWNNDTHPDVATVNTTDDSICVLRGNGTGTFSNLVKHNVNGGGPTSILNADFNADTFPDLVVTKPETDEVQVWRNNGAGAFTLNTTLSTGSGTWPLYAAAADLNADGRPDLAVALRDSDQVRVYLGTASGGFDPKTPLAPGAGPRSIAVADMNKDGEPDLVVGLSLLTGVGKVAVMTGDGNGNFAAPVATSTSSTGPRPDSVAVGDFNKDGNPDIVAASLIGGTLCVVETAANGAFLVADRIQLAANSTPTSVVVADFNKDGKPDVATTSNSTDEVAVARGDGLGGFLAPVRQTTGNLSAPWALVAVDLNGDQAPELVVLNDGTNNMSVLTNNGSGSFTSNNGQSIGVCQSPVAIAAGEINGDLKNDIAYVCDESYHLCFRLGTGSAGSGAFGAATCAFYDGYPDLVGVALGKFNFDDMMDAAFTSNTSDPPGIGVTPWDWLFGMFDSYPAQYESGLGPKGIARGRLNGPSDEYDDLVVANGGSTTISAFIGDGGGAFAPGIESAVGRNPNAVTLADFNLDGLLDAAAVNTNANNVSFLLGDGFGNFTKVGDFGTRDLPLSVAAGDFNLDGKPDLVASDYWAESLTVLLNQSSLVNPMETVEILGFDRTVFRWGLAAGAVYDVIRGSVNAMTVAPVNNNLGPVTCIANDLTVTDTGNTPDTVNPQVGEGFFYMVRTVIANVPSPYTVSSPDGRPGIPSSGGCF